MILLHKLSPRNLWSFVLSLVRTIEGTLNWGSTQKEGKDGFVHLFVQQIHTDYLLGAKHYGSMRLQSWRPWSLSPKTPQSGETDWQSVCHSFTVCWVQWWQFPQGEKRLLTSGVDWTSLFSLERCAWIIPILRREGWFKGELLQHGDSLEFHWNVVYDLRELQGATRWSLI